MKSEDKPQEKEITIKIQTLDNVTFKYKLKPTNTILTLKEEINKKYNEEV